MTQLTFQKVWSGNGLFQTILRTSATNFLVMVVSTLTSIVTARMFGVVGKGEFSAILFWPTLLAGLVGFGLPTSLIYNIKQNRGNEADFVRAGFLFQLPVSVVVGVIAWIWLPVWLGNYPDAIIQIARWYTVLMLPILLAVNLISALAQSTGKFNVYNGVRLYFPLINLIGLMVLWAAGNLSIHHASLVFLLTSVFVISWALYSMREALQIDWFKGSGNQTAAKALFGYGSKVFGVELLGTLYAQFDKLIILSMLTARDLGLYTVVYALSRVFNVVQTAITNVIFPKVTGMDKDTIMVTVGRAFRLSMILMMIIVVPCMFIGRYLMGILFGAPFLEASGAFYLLSIECILGGGSWILASSFNAMGRPGLVLVRQLIALAVTIGLFFVFTPLYGLNGIALALFIGAIIRLLVTMASMRIVFQMKMSSILFNKEDFHFLLERIKDLRKRKGAH
ncbi:O-antigen/teichoic acid export membrane protein [Paenibacillus anaericanus]|uniref:lipopolysaccharide biosynthesis protein n=1 Tax=Paenibacillus anaericanus TaxID=170367 RepID=UPI00278AC566|nr:oligosaccharide flippase family protein [Paenibacillus anaericanus]MDQ0086842.1 O-antigen/teichoic acid export membrane protein [Paenibacillus anaericanus]